ncbi:MAG: NAD(P)H-dependent glycerol-3-phosphate dehydrogenase [Planctomycetota bacterium]
MKVAILGNGGFGTAMALPLARAGHAVALWGHDPAYTASIAATRRNPRYLDGVALPDGVLVTADERAALRDAELVLVAVPTQHVRAVAARLAPVVPRTARLVSLAKGLEQATGKRPTQALMDELGGPERIFALSGPSHAEEIAHQLPTTVVVAGHDDAELQALQAALQTKAFRVYRNHDVLGIELCGALKNVMALAAGAEPRTFFGLAGVGDLAVTAFSRHGRNRAFGERIGRGETLAQALAASPKVAEGVWTSRVVVEQAALLDVELPIASAVARVLYDGLPPRDAVRALMERDPKAEA